MENHVTQYNAIARLIHWVSAAVIVGMFAVGLWMVDLSYYSEWYRIAPNWHKSVGVLLLALTLFRLVWKLVKPSPAIEGKKKRSHRCKSSASHDLFITDGAVYLWLFNFDV